MAGNYLSLQKKKTNIINGGFLNIKAKTYPLTTKHTINKAFFLFYSFFFKRKI
jgi:hypothetical protein